MGILENIKNAGFKISLSVDTFTVCPASRLTTEQRDFLKTHKAEIVKKLAARTATHQNSEAEHNAQGRFFKWLITLPDGCNFIAAAMPRRTLAETREQFPGAVVIEPIAGEDYQDE